MRRQWRIMDQQGKQKADVRGVRRHRLTPDLNKFKL